MDIKIHQILMGSRANGPGNRNVVWFQGCTLDCPGCFNPQTHAANSGKKISADKLGTLLLGSPGENDGITISGGEPFQQPEGLLELLQYLKERQSPPILVFSGYTLKEIQNDPARSACLPYIDALICGRFCREFPPDYAHFCSSSNQSLILNTPRFKETDFCNLTLQELIVENGHVIISGIFSRS